MRRSLAPAAVVLALACIAPACSGDDGTATSSSSSDAGPTGTADRPSGTSEPTAEVDQTAPAGANGIKAADDGTLWVAVIDGDEVLQVDAASGTVLARYAVPTGTGPDDLVLGGDGTVYVTGFTSGDVLALDPASGETRSLGNVGAGANPIALLDADSLVVGRAVTATGLFSVDPTGETEPRALADPGNVNSFDLDEYGTLYGPLTGDSGGSAIAIDPATGETVRTVAPLPGIPLGLRTLDERLYVLVLDGTAKVVTIDVTVGEVVPFGDTGLAVADNLAVADDGTVYVTGFDAATITLLGPGGQVTETLPIGQPS